MGKTQQKTSFSHRLLDTIPDPLGLLGFEQLPVEAIQGEALIVLDTSAILWLYEFTTESIEKIEKQLNSLASQRRLLIPMHAIREFLANRARKLDEVGHALEQFETLVVPNVPSMRYLQIDSAFEEFRSKREAAKNAISELNAAATGIYRKLRADVGADALSRLLRNISGIDGTTLDLDWSEEQRADFLTELERRFSLGIGPGLRDEAKADEGSGDVIIWKTLLAAAATRSVHTILVSNDTKDDWFVRSVNRRSRPVFQVRHDLVDEYRRQTGGKTIRIIPFSEFLDILNADEALREEAAEVDAKQSEIEGVLRTQRIPPIVHEIEKQLHSTRSQMNAAHEHLMSLQAALSRHLEYVSENRDSMTEDDFAKADTRYGHLLGSVSLAQDALMDLQHREVSLGSQLENFEVHGQRGVYSHSG